MNKVAEFWRSHSDESGKLLWPESEAERNDFARTIFGLCFVEALDYWLDRAEKHVDSSRQSPVSRKETDDMMKMREVLSNLDDSQRHAVRKLLRETLHATIFSTLTRIDQMPGGHFEILLAADENSPQRITGTVHPSRDDLHDQLYKWIWEFSGFRDQLMTRRILPGGGTVEQFTVSGDPRPAPIDNTKRAT